MPQHFDNALISKHGGSYEIYSNFNGSVRMDG